VFVNRPDDGCIAETCSLVYYSNIYCCARLYSFVPIDISHNGMDSVKIVHTVLLMVLGNVLFRSDINTEEINVEFGDVCGSIDFHTV
jgi:hypothetical protein